MGFSAPLATPAVRLGIAEVERRVGLERSTISRRCHAATFPLPHYIGTRRYWYEHELVDWEHQQLARQAEAERYAHEIMQKAQAARRSALAAPAANDSRS